MSFDTKCFELAEYFLPDGAPLLAKNALAEIIQETVEDFLIAAELEAIIG